MNIDLRIIFLFLLAVTAFLFIARNRGGLLSLGELAQIIVDFLLVLAMAGTAITFGFLLARQDPLPLIRELAYRQSFDQLVSFEHIIPPNLEKSLAISEIYRMDTDGDGFNEWVVFYQFDLQNTLNPVRGAVYDSDRGDPPVLFPYNLLPPNRDYLSESRPSLSLQDVTVDKNGPNNTDVKELLVQSTHELSIFRYHENSAQWDFPRDSPPRYQPIGFFRGSGGVSFDKTSKQVTVLDRDSFERSQLVVRSVYALNPATNTYWDQYYDLSSLDRKLGKPLVLTIDFLDGAPEDIYEVAYPEKIVLAFYVSTCSSSGEALCRLASAGWQPKNFLDPNGDAYIEFQNKNFGYFGLPSFSHSADISVSYLRYFPQLETDADLLTSGGGRDLVTGEQAQSDVVDITFTLSGDPQEQARRFAMTWVDGQWKITRRLPVNTPTLGEPSQIQANPAQ